MKEITITKQNVLAVGGVVLVGALMLFGLWVVADSDAKWPVEVETVQPVKWTVMSNTEIIAATKECNAAGLEAEALFVKHIHGDQVVKIECRPVSLSAK